MSLNEIAYYVGMGALLITFLSILAIYHPGNLYKHKKRKRKRRVRKSKSRKKGKNK